MTQDDVEAGRRRYLLEIVGFLEEVVAHFVNLVGPPTYVKDGELSQWLYTKPSWAIYQTLKMVRVVSGLRAALILLAEGHVTEVGVLIRTIDEFLDAVLFADEPIEKGVTTAEQQKEFDFFFRDFRDDTEKRRAGTFTEFRPEKNKVQASQARALGPENPHDTKLLVKTIDDSFSGYVHGDIPTIMEMYVGGHGFSMRGMQETPRMAEFRSALARVIHNGLNSVLGMAIRSGQPELAEQLRRRRIALEESGVCKT